jgi:hypothetical protein
LLLVAEQELSPDGLWAEARWIDGQPGVQVEPEAAVGIDVAVDQGRDSSQVVGIEAGAPGGLGQDLLDHEGVDIDERQLDQV